MKTCIIKIFTGTLSVLLFAICIGCSSNDLDKVITNNYNNPSVPVNVKVEGIGWEEEPVITRAADKVEKTIIPVNDELDIIATIEPYNDAITTTRASEILKPGIIYRVIAFEQGGAGDVTKYVKHADFKVGTTPDTPFTLPWGCTYDIVCYSNNDTDNLGVFDAEIYDFLYAAGKIPLYCKTSLTVPVNTPIVSLNITFKHLDSMVKIIVNDDTDNLSIKEISNVTIGPHYNKIKMDLSGHRNNPGTVFSSFLPVVLKKSNDKQWESEYIHIFSHDDDDPITPSISIQTIKLQNSAGKEFVISDKTLNPVRFEMSRKYKVTFIVETRNTYTITASAMEESDDSDVVSKYSYIAIANNGGSVQYTSNRTTFTGKLGAYAVATHTYNQGIGTNNLAHYLFAGWQKRNEAGVWEQVIGTDKDISSILLNLSLNENGAQYRAFLKRDRRIIKYDYTIVGDYLQGGTGATGETIVHNIIQQEAYKEFETAIWAGSQPKKLPEGVWHLVTGVKLKKGWVLLNELKYTQNQGWGFGIDDRLFVPFDDLPGDTEPKTNQIKFYAAFYPNASFISTVPPQNDAEWESFDIWKAANTIP